MHSFLVQRLLGQLARESSASSSVLTEDIEILLSGLDDEVELPRANAEDSSTAARLARDRRRLFGGMQREVFNALYSLLRKRMPTAPVALGKHSLVLCCIFVSDCVFASSLLSLCFSSRFLTFFFLSLFPSL